MKTPERKFLQSLAGLLLATALAASGPTGAATTDIATAPLASSASASVLPNLMFTLDASGSMAWDYLPDFIVDGGTGTCKTRVNSASSGDYDNCVNGDPPFYSAQFNGAYYNPLLTYKPAVSYNGTSLGSYNTSAKWAAVLNNAFDSGSGTLDLTSKYPEVVYCSDSGLTLCKQNGIDTNATFEYRVPPTATPSEGVTYGYPESADGAINVGTGMSISKAAGTATVTVAKTGHGLLVADILNVNCTSGTTRAVINTTTALVTAVTSTTFSYSVPTSPSTNVSAAASGSSCTVSAKRNGFDYRKSINSVPHYYTITPTEYCSDTNLTTCVAATAPSGTNVNPAFVRYCNTLANANANAPVTGAGTCQAKYTSTYLYPRYGKFTRTNIVPATTSYGGRPNRIDCASAPSCTYSEEMTNFANWYAYYRTRIQFMKTAAGQAFLPIDNRYRVGFITINPGSPVSTSYYLPIATFDSSQKQSWYNLFYSQTPSGGTPLREALSRVGRHFAGITTGLNKGMSQDPVQYSCQQNFTIMTTDGYWNGNSSQDLSGNTIGNYDNNQDVTPSPLWDGGATGSKTTTTTTTSYTSTTSGCTGGKKKITTTVAVQKIVTPLSGSVALSGTTTNTTSSSTGSCVSTAVPANTVVTTSSTSTADIGGTTDTLADTAAYYYQTDLRPAGSKNAANVDVSKNNVPTSPKDSAAWQHMTTFTLGLVDGLMTFDPTTNYETATTGDFANIKNQANNACFWTTGTCVWPAPVHDDLSALDDLWHAAVDGHGTFYQAKNPAQLATGLSGALAGLNTRTAAAAASATSSPNITPTDNAIFSSTYTTVEWAGEVVKQTIDTQTGAVDPTILWSAQTLLDAQTSASSDSRTIYMFDSTATTKLKSFAYAGMTAAEKAFFDNKCVPTSNLSQCITLTTPQLTTANSGLNLVGFLRGQTVNEGGVYRDRTHILGDTVNATPAFLRDPRFAFGDAVTPSYATFKLSNASRQPTLFIAANDGMLHAFNGDTGAEMWAYIPKPILPNLYKLADINYAAKHQYFADGSPELMDAYFGGAWHTVLIAGLNSGGRGYYALDVTDPTTPKALWEFCSDSTLCSISDTDLGLTYGNAVISKRPTDGKWVVMVGSGYNNVSPGTGKAFLFVLDLATGAVLSKLDTTTGTTTSPAGLGKIAVWADNANIDNTGKYVYGGDLLGNVWRFDMTSATPGILKLATLADSASRPQSVTTRPELADIQGNRVVYFGTGRYLGTTDLTDPATWSPASTDAYQQSFYAFKDKGTSYGNLRASGNNLVKQTITIIDDNTRTTTKNAVDWNSNNGWYVDFNPSNDTPGERVNIDPQLVLGTLLVITNVPNTDACTIGGESWLYQFNYQSGQYIATSPNNAVANKLGNAITVGLVVVRLPGGSLKAISTDASGTKSTFGVNIGGSTASGKRTSWREIIK
ncbi:MAG TPA: PilC/PilY family type IV pilus protein [Burkholderiales bacterium]|nr:PilC/PilY family type IV pilus protein [Burkholderiales bacterium]